MGLTPKKPKEGPVVEPIENDTYHGVIYALWDLGMQYSEFYKQSRERLIVSFELPDVRIEIEGEDLPRVVSKEYTHSYHTNATWRKHLESIRGKKFTDEERENFHPRQILGVNCLVEVGSREWEGKTYNQVNNVAKLLKGISKKKAENEYGWYDLDDEDANIPENCPDWIADKIKKSPDWQRLAGMDIEEPPPDIEELDAPF